MRRLLELLTAYDTEPLECSLGLQALAWGLWLLLPLDTFGLAASYRLLEAVAPEGAWGLLFALGGAWQLGAAWQGARAWPRQLSAMAAFVCWSFLAVFHWLGSDGTSAAAPIYGVIAVVCGWLYLRLWSPARGRSGD